MNIKKHLPWLGALLPVASMQAETKPNVVVIYIDDMGIGDIGCYGGKFVPTPNIYRTGTLQPLALLAWRGWLPKELSNGQVRAAMTAVINRMFGDNRNFNEKGFLTLGFNGSQPHISDWYTNNGSLYMASLAFLPLGLPADHPFWTDAPQAWTSKKAWGGEEFPKDHAYYE